MIPCPNCGVENSDRRNFCSACKHRLGKIEIRFGKGTRINHAVERFWELGDPAAFAKPGALDYDPHISTS